MASLLRSGMPALAKQGLSPQYLIGATAAGAVAVQGSEVWRAASDIVYFRTDKHVHAWVLSLSKDPLDLLVVAEHAEAHPASPQANARGAGQDLAEEQQPGEEDGGKYCCGGS